MSKVRKFEEKQEYSKQQLKLIEELKKRGSDVKSDIITPEQIKQQDVLLKDEKVPEGAYYEGGKLITPKDLEEEKKKEAEEKVRYTKEFKKQLKSWIKKEESKDYENVEFDHDDYLVRLFKMDVSSFDKFVTLEYEWSPVLGRFKLKDKPATSNVFPIVKILKVGKGINSEKGKVYQEGDICIVPSTDVVGEDWNPKFLHFMQFQESQGMKPKLPDGLRQSIPNVEKNWERYKFIRPWLAEAEEIDHLTYLIPAAKIRGSYKG